MPRTIRRKNQKMFPGRPKKSEKVKFLSKLFFHLPLWSQIADLITRLQIFRRKSEIFSPKGRNYFKKPTMFPSKCSSGHVECIFVDSVKNFRQSSKSFGSKCTFDDCWNSYAASSINFAWKTKLNWKTNKFLMKTPQKFSGRLKCNYNKNDETFFPN